MDIREHFIAKGIDGLSQIFGRAPSIVGLFHAVDIGSAMATGHI